MINKCLVHSSYFSMSSDLGVFDHQRFDPYSFFPGKSRTRLRMLITGGLNQYLKKRMIRNAEGIDYLYRSKDSRYLRLCSEFVRLASRYDAIIFMDFNFIHPEVLFNELPGKKKILAFTDDPYSTYIRGIPYIHAFDGCIYISPSYINDLGMKNTLLRAGAKNTHWMPLVSNHIRKFDFDFLWNKKKDIVSYIGNPTLSKYDRLVKVKKVLKGRFDLHGRWPLKGCTGFIGPMFGNQFYFKRITQLSGSEKDELMIHSLVGLNMHVSEEGWESGNMRTYEVPAYGGVLLTNKTNNYPYDAIFNDREAIFYSNIDEAISLCEGLFSNRKAAYEIAKGGYDKFWSEYAPEKVCSDLKDWLDAL